MLGGALRGFNLLLVLAGLIVGLLIMHWRWSRRAIEAISVTRRLPTEAFAGRPFQVRFLLRNHSRMMPVWMIRVEDRIESAARKDRPSTDRASAICGVGVIPADQTERSHYDCVITRRGRYRFGPLTMMTSFPLSLISSRQIISTAEELVVLPELLRLPKNWERQLISRSGGMASSARQSGPNEGDFFGLREWRHGDSLKWIHWRTSARLAEPAVRQFEQQRRFDTCVMVDAYQGPVRGIGDGTEIELAISLAATFVIQLVGYPSNRVVLAVASAAADAVIGGGSSVGKRRILETLAEIVPTEYPQFSAAVQRARHLVGGTQDLIIISPRSFEQANQADSSLSPAISPWVGRSAFRWINAMDLELKRWISRVPVEARVPRARSDR